MKKLFLTTLILLLINSITAQDFNQWQNLTSMNFVNGIEQVPDGFWAASTGGAYKYNNGDGSYLKLNIVDGLSSSLLTAVATDKFNRVWFGTDNGILNVFNPEDNSVNKILDIYNSDQTLKRINSITASGDLLYVAHDFGVSVIEMENLTTLDTYSKYDQFPSGIKVNSLYISDLIYLCTKNGLAVQVPGATNLVAPESWQTFNINNSDVYKLVEFKGKLLACTDKGLYSQEANGWASLLTSLNNITDIQVNGGSLYVLQKNRLQKYDGSNLSIVYETSTHNLFRLVVESDSEFIIASNFGTIKLTGAVVENLAPNSPTNNSFLDLAVGHDGTLYCATGKDGAGAGIFRYDGTNWDVFNSNNTPEFANNDFRYVSSSASGKVYFMSWGQGFTISDGEGLTTYNADNSSLIGITDNQKFVVITGAAEDNSGNTWVTNYINTNREPLSVLTAAGEWHHFSPVLPGVVPIISSYFLIIDRYNTKWFADPEAFKGLYYFNENNSMQNIADDVWGRLTTSNGLNSNTINCLALDNRGEIWIGTDDGVNYISNPNQPSAVSNTLNLSTRNKNIQCMAVDAINRKWVGTSEGVFLISQDGSQTIENFNTQNSPLPSDNINSIAIDHNSGTVYIATDYGIASLITTAIKPNATFDDLFAYPNPLIINSGSALVKIDGLIKNSSIKILSTSGTLIREIDTDGGRIATWDARDENGKLVPSGIYIIVAYDDEASNVSTTKIAVLRK